MGGIVQYRALKQAEPVQGVVALLNRSHHRVEIAAEPGQFVVAVGRYPVPVIGLGSHSFGGCGQRCDRFGDGAPQHQQLAPGHAHQNQHAGGEQPQKLLRLLLQLLQADAQAEAGAAGQGLQPVGMDRAQIDAVGVAGRTGVGVGADAGQQPAVAEHDVGGQQLRIALQRIENFLGALAVFERYCRVGADRDQLRVGFHELAHPLFQRQVLVNQQAAAHQDEGQDCRSPQYQRQPAVDGQAHRHRLSHPA